MPKSRAFFKDRVAARIDEVTLAVASSGGKTAIEDPHVFIDSELDFSADWVVRNAEYDLVLPVIVGDKKHFRGSDVEDVDTRVIIDSDTYKAVIVCPADFSRFVSLRLSGWKATIRELMDPRDPKYRQLEYNKYTSGSPQKPRGVLVGFTDYIASEKAKYTLNQTLTSNIGDINLMVDGYTPPGGSQLSTGDIVALTGQNDYDQNAIYKINASDPPTLLDSSVTTTNPNQAIEAYRASGTSDVIDEFQYVPRLKPEELPDNNLIDATIFHCAGRVLSYMGESAKAAEMQAIAMNLISLKSGLENES